MHVVILKDATGRNARSCEAAHEMMAAKFNPLCKAIVGPAHVELVEGTCDASDFGIC
jgi:hypothetical protein